MPLWAHPAPALFIALLALSLGCASASGRPSLPVAEVSSGSGLDGARSWEVLWEVPGEMLRTQRLFRARYDGPQGEGGFRLTLRLVALDRYQARAVDALGRGVWALEATPQGALWLDLRQKVYCRSGGRLEMPGSPLSPLPVAGFPALLLGRLPIPPASAVRAAEKDLRFEDGEGRQWRVRTEQAALASWSVWQGHEPIAWWSVNAQEAVLSDRREGVQLRWRQVVAEPLSKDLAPLEIPSEFRPVACTEVRLEPPVEEP